MSRFKRQCLAVVATVLLLITASAQAQEPILALDGPDLAFESPQVAANGLRAVAVRTHYEDETFPMSGVAARWRDVVALALRADCAEDLVLELTHDGVSFGASIDAFGQVAHFWREAGAGGYDLVRHVLATGVETVLLTESTEPRAPDTSPDMTWATWRRQGVPEALVLADLAPTWLLPPMSPALTTVATGTLALAHDRPLLDDGVVRFAQELSGVMQLMQADDTATTPLTTGTSDHGPPSVSADGSRMAFWRTTSGGLTNVFVRDSLGATIQITPNASTTTTFSDVSIASDGEWVVFASTGDWDPSMGNSDGSNEIFRARADGTGSIEQLSSINVNQGREVLVSGTTASGHVTTDGSVVLFGASTGGAIGYTADVLHQIALHVLALDAPSTGTVSTWNATLTSVAPPFDIRSDVPGLDLPACRLVAGSLLCRSWLRNSIDEKRNLLLVPEWNFESPAACGNIIVGAVRQVSLDAQEGVVVSASLPMACAGTGSYRLRAIDLENAQADLVIQFEELFW